MAKRKPYVDKVKGISWEFHLQSTAAYSRMHGKDSGAITYLGDRQVWFSQSQLSPGNVRHEVFHVYIASSGINSATLTADNMEEICAEIYETFGPEMDLLVDKILEHFLR
jgi:aspartate/tyrosine/aromatic aminotransferase